MFYMSHEWQNRLQDQVIWSIQQANFKEKNPETTTDEWDKTWRRTESYKWHFNIKILLMKWHIECVLLTWCVVTAAVFAGTESVWHVWLFGIHLIPCGGTNTHTDTHTDTHRHSHRQIHTHTQRLAWQGQNKWGKNIKCKSPVQETERRRKIKYQIRKNKCVYMCTHTRTLVWSALTGLECVRHDREINNKSSGLEQL